MSNQKRKEVILALLEENGKVNVNELAKAMNVSEKTIRRDLDKMGKEGLLIRTHGGAKYLDREDVPIHQRKVEPLEEQTEVSGKEVVDDLDEKLPEDEQLVEGEELAEEEELAVDEERAEDEELLVDEELLEGEELTEEEELAAASNVVKAEGLMRPAESEKSIKVVKSSRPEWLTRAIENTRSDTFIEPSSFINKEKRVKPVEYEKRVAANAGAIPSVDDGVERNQPRNIFEPIRSLRDINFKELEKSIPPDTLAELIKLAESEILNDSRAEAKGEGPDENEELVEDIILEVAPGKAVYKREVLIDEEYTGEVSTEEEYTEEYTGEYTEEYTGEVPTDEEYTEEVPTGEEYTEEVPTDEEYVDEMFVDDQLEGEVLVDDTPADEELADEWLGDITLDDERVERDYQPESISESNKLRSNKRLEKTTWQDTPRKSKDLYKKKIAEFYEEQERTEKSRRSYQQERENRQKRGSKADEGGVLSGRRSRVTDSKGSTRNKKGKNTKGSSTIRKILDWVHIIVALIIFIGGIILAVYIIQSNRAQNMIIQENNSQYESVIYDDLSLSLPIDEYLNRSNVGDSSWHSHIDICEIQFKEGESFGGNLCQNRWVLFWG